MKGERGNFRTVCFGGFNKSDVVKYITKLAEERNRYKAMCEEKEEEIEDLIEECDDLRFRLRETERTITEREEEAEKARLEAIKSAKDVLSSFEKKYGDVSAQMDDSISELKNELLSVMEGIEKISEMIGKTGQSFEELHKELDEDAK